MYVCSLLIVARCLESAACSVLAAVCRMLLLCGGGCLLFLAGCEAQLFVVFVADCC